MIDASEGGVNLRILDFGIAIIDQFRSWRAPHREGRASDRHT